MNQTQPSDDSVVVAPYKINWDKVQDVDRVHPPIAVSNKFVASVYEDALPGKSPLPIVYEVPTDDEMNAWLADLPNYMEGLFSFNNEDLYLEDYQRAWVNDKSTFRWSGKSRRVGISLICAAEALAESQLVTINKDWTFVSYTMEEAINKMQYARAIYDAMPERFKRKRVRDRRQSLEFSDPINNVTTRLISHAQRAPRGNGGSLLFDELAHCQWARKLYEAGLACILTGDGRMSVVSTPFGEGDLFHEIGTDNRRYGKYSRHFIYWWECTWLCKDVIGAKKFAPMMSTVERVNIFGNDKLKDLFASYGDEDSFRQEMEVGFISEVFKYYPRALIYQCVYPWSSTRYVDEMGVIHAFDSSQFSDEDGAGIDMSAYEWVDHNDTPQPSAYKIISKYVNFKNVKFFKYDTVDELLRGYMSGEIGIDLLGGYDVGRSKDPSELSIFEEIRLDDGRTLKVERFSEQLKNMLHHEQRQYLIWILTHLYTLRIQVDANGMGSAYYDELNAMFPNRIFPSYFDTLWKSDVCKLFKNHLEAMSIALAEEKNSIDQIHSIRRTISSNMLELFHADKTEKEHHGDKFWAKAMAIGLGVPPENQANAMSIDVVGSFDHGRLFDSFGKGVRSADVDSNLSSRPRMFPSLSTGSPMGLPLPVVTDEYGFMGNLPSPLLNLSGLKPPERL